MRTVTTLLLILSLVVPPLAARGDEPAVARHGIRPGQVGPGQVGPGQVGAVLFDPATGAVVAGHGADTPLAPASVAKLVTAAAGLAVLGPEHRFVTELRITGGIRAGVLEGDLILVGGGDPTLATEGLVALARELAAWGVRRVAGRFLYDSTAVPEVAEIDPGQPWTAGYNAGIGALTLNFNRFQLVWNALPGGAVKAGAWAVSDAGRHPIDTVRIDIDPGGAVPLVPLPDGDHWRLAPGPGVPERSFLPLTRPGAATAAVFRRVAAETGVALPEPNAGAAPSDAVAIVRHRSAPLTDVLAGVLRWSNNPSAELIGLAVAARLDPTARGLEGTAAAVARWLEGKLPEVDWRGFRHTNHSGLSARSRLTARQIAAVLRLGGPALAALLPARGGEASGPAAVRAKSGTLAYARGLAGFLRAGSGRNLGFVVLIGDEERRRMFDATLDRSVRDLPPQAIDWILRARGLEADLVGDWIVKY